MKSFITHLVRFYGESRRAPDHVQNHLRRQGKETGLAFAVTEGWGWGEGNLVWSKS